MSRHVRALGCAMLTAATAGGLIAALPATAQASQITPGFYDCWGYGGVFTYYGTYEFKTPGSYLFAADRKGHRLIGKVDKGNYKLHGRKLIPTSGPMKSNHLYMVEKNSHEWLLANPNHLAIGCYLTAH